MDTEGASFRESLDTIKSYFDNQLCKEAWYGYSFGPHVFGIDVNGFAYDTSSQILRQRVVHLKL